MEQHNGAMERNGDGKQRHTVIELIDHQQTQGLLLHGEERKSYTNSLSAREMDSLTAICDTFLPSIAVSDHINVDDSAANMFFLTSASMAGTPERVAGLISERVRHPKKWLVRFTLWMLSTWIGTFIICGFASVRSHFPYMQRLSQVSQKKREEIIVSWSLSYFKLLRMLFKSLKFLILFVYFTQVDEKNDNPSWKAIGYSGPDPDFRIKTRLKGNESSKLEEYEQKEGGEEDEETLFGPLYRSFINLENPREVVAHSLKRLGFLTSIPHRKVTTPSISHPSMIIKCDAVVVGSGSGGGVVAGVLANAGHKVLVLEKGTYCARTNLTLLEGQTMNQMYFSSGLVATEDTSVIILAGSTVGGGSTINWSASLRTPKNILKHWSNAYELELFDSKLYKEAMEIVCDKMGVQSEVDREGFNNAVLRRGCEELGYPVNNIPRNAPSDHYCGWCCLGCKDGRKKGTAETWLVDLVNSGNGAILSGCEAVKILHKRRKGQNRNTASGVAFEFVHGGGKDICIVESKVTIVACGALGTPPLLKRSGLKNPNIGKNLHLHPVTMAWGHFPDKADYTVWPEGEKKSYEGGIMTAMSTVVADPIGLGYGAVIQTPALHPGMFSVLTPWCSGEDFRNRMLRFSRTATIFALARDKGSGAIHSSSSISYQLDPVDEDHLKKGLEKVLRILAAAGAEEIGTHHPEGKMINVKKVSYREFEKFVKEESSRPLNDLSAPICSAHQMSSCRMGVDAKSSVVNEMGETWEVEGLFVADTSVFPTALGVNPMVTVQAIAYCTAQSVLEVLRRKRNR